MSSNKFLVLIIFILMLTPFLFSQNKNSDEEIKAQEGKIIRNIEFRRIDISGPSILDGDSGVVNWWGNIVNSLHNKTKSWVIENRLLFKKGDRLRFQKISDSERLLRSSGYFLDANIRVKKALEDSVDILVVTKDKWTISLLASYDGESHDAYLGIRDENLFGIGHSANLTITDNNDNLEGWGGSLNYTAVNLKGSYIDANLSAKANGKLNIESLGLSRSFVTTETKWIGGLNLSFEYNHLEYIKDQNEYVSIPYTLNNQDVWLGHSFPIDFGSANFKNTTRIITAARISRTNHSSRPEVSADSNRLFENKTIYLFSSGIITRNFYKDKYIEEFGTTEDIPTGGILSITTGEDDRELGNRWYLGSSAIYSEHIQNFGYVSGKLEVSGFKNGTNWEQNVINFNLLYHSRLYNKDDWKLRFFIQNDYLFGFNRFEGEQIYITSETGLRGVNNGDKLHGTKSNILNLEARIFSPYSPLGFVLGANVFADFGLVAEKEVNLINSQLYQAYGFGIRTKNESITRTNFSISLVYNPYLPSKNSGAFSVLFMTNIIIGFRQFNFEKPSVINYDNQSH